MSSEKEDMSALRVCGSHLGDVVEEMRAASLVAHEYCRAVVGEAALQAAFQFESPAAVWRLSTTVIAASKSLEALFQPVVVAQERYAALLEPVEAALSGLRRMPFLASQALEVQRSLLEPEFGRLEEIYRELPPRTREALLLLAEHGWYLDPEMSLPELWDLKKALSEGNVGGAEDALVDHFEGRLDEIEKSITERFPHRARLIQKAFDAHRREEYELSIPVLLAQTDGICKEVADQYLFIKRDKKPRTAIYVEQLAGDALKAAFLSPLTRTLPISASEHERAADGSLFNRHTVLHGDSLDYGTRINGLKAISLINYVAQVLGTARDCP